MIVAVHIVLLIALFVWLLRKYSPIISLALLLKVCAGIGLGLLYQHYYTAGDTWTFFYDAKNVASMLRENPSEFINFFWFDDWSKVNETLGSSGLRPLFMVKWVAVINLLTGDNYWLASAYLSLVSFYGAWLLFTVFTKCFPNAQKEAVVAILFVPSVVFWSSGVIKECLGLGALFCLSGMFLNWYVHKEFSRLDFFLTIISLWILWNLKYYWLAVWLAAVFPLITIKALTPSGNWFKEHSKISWLILFCVSVVCISTWHPNFYYYRILTVVVDNYYTYVQLSNPGDVIYYGSLEPNLLSVAKNVPQAVIGGFFRPFIWESRTAFQFASGVENLILMALFVLALFQFKQWSTRFNALHLALVFYLIMLAALLALSTPNFGSLSRYRIGFTPFLWLILLIASKALEYLPKRLQNLLAKV